MKRYHRKEERGIALALVAMFLGVIFAMMVIAVDVGRFAHTGSEVQAIADLSALSGARSVLVRGPGTAQSGADAAARQNVADGRTFVDDGTRRRPRTARRTARVPSTARKLRPARQAPRSNFKR